MWEVGDLHRDIDPEAILPFDPAVSARYEKVSGGLALNAYAQSMVESIEAGLIAGEELDPIHCLPNGYPVKGDLTLRAARNAGTKVDVLVVETDDPAQYHYESNIGHRSLPYTHAEKSRHSRNRMQRVINAGNKPTEWLDLTYPDVIVGWDDLNDEQRDNLGRTVRSATEELRKSAKTSWHAVVQVLGHSGMTQQEIANELGLEQRTVSRYGEISILSKPSSEYFGLVDALSKSDEITATLKDPALIEKVCEEPYTEPETQDFDLLIKRFSYMITDMKADLDWSRISDERYLHVNKCISDGKKHYEEARTEFLKDHKATWALAQKDKK